MLLTYFASRSVSTSNLFPVIAAPYAAVCVVTSCNKINSLFYCYL